MEMAKGSPVAYEGTKAAERRELEQLAGRRLARAYVPFQRYTRRFDPDEGLAKGTIFPDLYSPYRASEK